MALLGDNDYKEIIYDGVGTSLQFQCLLQVSNFKLFKYIIKSYIKYVIIRVDQLNINERDKNIVISPQIQIMEKLQKQLNQNQNISKIDIPKREFEIIDIQTAHNFYQQGMFIVKQEIEEQNNFKPSYYIVSKTRLQQFISEGVYRYIYTGLFNFCSSCYMNASIQFISHSYYFQRLFTSDGYKQIMQASNPFKILTNTINQMTEKVLKPTQMAKLIQLFNMSINQQADSTELTNRLLVQLSQDEVQFANQQNADEQIKQTTAIDQLCQSRIKQTIECKKCHNKIITYTNYFMLQAECKKNLKRSLLDFIKTQNISGYNCDKCKQISEITKTMEIIHFPRVLMINLIRYTVNLQKKNNQCQLPLYINSKIPIQQWKENTQNLLDQLNQESNENTHKLVGVINHIGSLDFGHYFYYGKIEQQWYQFDDENVTKIDQEQVISGEHAVLLMYEMESKENMIQKIESENQIQQPKEIQFQEEQKQQEEQQIPQQTKIQEEQIKTVYYKEVDKNLQNENKIGGRFSTVSDIIHQKYKDNEMSQFYLKKRKTKQVREQNKRKKQNLTQSQKFNKKFQRK